MKNGFLYRLLRILFASIFILGTIGIIFIGWKTYDDKNKAVLVDIDSSLNAVNCSNGKGYKIGQYTGIHNKSDLNFLDDVEFRYLCSRGFDIAQADKQKIIDFIAGQDTSYFSKLSNSSKIYEDVFGNWPLVSPFNIYVVNPQLTDSQVEQAVIQLNHKYYDNISYSLVNIPKPKTLVKFDYTSTFLTFLLFLFIVLVLQKLTYYAIGKGKVPQRLIKLNKQFPFILPALIIGGSIVVVANLATNNAHPQELLTLNQKCHDLAKKYVDDQNTKYKSNTLAHETDYSTPYSYITTLNSYTYSQQLNTCLTYYAVIKSVNPMASPTPSPLPSKVELTDYVDNVISGKNLAQINLDTDCNMNKNYCQNLVNFNLKLRSLGLSDMNYWQMLFLQTVGRLSFVRSWVGL